MFMKRTCPECGKKMYISPEELEARNGVAVCPQCLAMFYPNGRPEDDNTDANPGGHHGRADRTVGDAHTYRYCYRCGEQLPGNVPYCPYCGEHLSERTDDDAYATSTDAPQYEDSRNVSQEPTTFAQPSPAGKQERAEEPMTARTMERRDRPVLARIDFFKRSQDSLPASLPVQLVCYTVIIALLAVLVYIIYKASLIS